MFQTEKITLNTFKKKFILSLTDGKMNHTPHWSAQNNPDKIWMWSQRSAGLQTSWYRLEQNMLHITTTTKKEKYRCTSCLVYAHLRISFLVKYVQSWKQKKVVAGRLMHPALHPLSQERESYSDLLVVLSITTALTRIINLARSIRRDLGSNGSIKNNTHWPDKRPAAVQ